MRAFYSPDVLPYVHILLAGLPLKLVCAWCGLVIRKGVGPVSHGMCSACQKQFEAEAGR